MSYATLTQTHTYTHNHTLPHAYKHTTLTREQFLSCLFSAVRLAMQAKKIESVTTNDECPARLYQINLAIIM